MWPMPLVILLTCLTNGIPKMRTQLRAKRKSTTTSTF
ncbi:hypothetical protein AWRI1631_20710 [Saccharomyces cerevisiae AWRI1631]|uniref:Uncharacterized protein n=1 Tax=Saccharomyces cerevisiae (strain AWRI1631) TaxID=545124 RepID=B5VDV1_YEAS6|nr:hypothetical protein AWRI1631_20710 [Saccharomyces cerevisiae AWRI1631]